MAIEKVSRADATVRRTREAIFTEYGHGGSDGTFAVRADQDHAEVMTTAWALVRAAEAVVTAVPAEGISESQAYLVGFALSAACAIKEATKVSP